EAGKEEGRGRKRRRRRRGRRGGESFPQEREGGAFVLEAADAAHAGEQDADGAPEARESGNGAARAEMPGEPGGDGERRRRRRGRRGGRRNRRPPPGRGLAAGAHEGSAGGGGDAGGGFGPRVAETVEPELAHSVTDLDAAAPAGAATPPTREAPAAEPQSELPAPFAAEPRESSPPTPAPAAAETPTAPEAPRRRSTVGEPAPQGLDHEGHVAMPPFTTQPAPAVEPVVSSSTEDESGDRPRRSGWWSKRVLGKG